jgi:chromosome partitioning protein
MIIAIANHKGGTGKTTTTINLGAALQSLGFKVLLVDLDPQANLSYAFGIQSSLNIYDFLVDDVPFENTVSKVEGLEVLSSDMRLADIELTLQKMENRAYVLKNNLEMQFKAYDYVLIDCPPSRSLLTVNALSVADYVIIGMLLDVMSIQGLNHLLKTVQDIQRVYHPQLKILGVLALNVEGRKKIAKEVWDFVKANFDLPFFKTKIRSNVKVAEAPSHASSVIKYAPLSTASKDYKDLAKEIVKNGIR